MSGRPTKGLTLSPAGLDIPDGKLKVDPQPCP